MASLIANEHHILAYIQESIQTIQDGKQLSPQQAAPLVINGFFKDALAMDETLSNAFSQLSTAKQREYYYHIAEAKQEATKIKRMAKITPMILAGEGLNDRYKR